jgi:hypothetical protein
VVALDGGLLGLDLGEDRAAFGVSASVAVTMPRSGTGDCVGDEGRDAGLVLAEGSVPTAVSGLACLGSL